MHNNSKAAFKSITESGAKNNRKRDILEFYLKNPTMFYADYEICFGLGFADLNKCRPRISDMFNDPKDPRVCLLEEGPPKKSHDSNLNVRTSRIRPSLIEQQTSLL